MTTAAEGRSRPMAPPAFLTDVYDAASECNKCSLCQAVCPTYVVNPVEWETARGRVSLVRDAIEGRLPLADIADGPLSTCLTCDNCVAACAPRVPTAAIVSRARQELHEQVGMPLARSILLRTFLSRPGGVRWLRRLARLSQLTGLRGLAARTGVLPHMGTTGRFAAHVGPVPSRSVHDLINDLPPVTGPVRAEIGLLLCCLQDLALPDVSCATVRTLRAHGFSVTIPPVACSGLPARVLGDRDSEIEMGVRTVDACANVPVEAWVGDAAACTQHVRGLGELLASDATGTRARDLATRTWQLSRFLETQGLRAPLGPLRWRVAIDEPCSLPIGGVERGSIGRLLGQVPRLEIVPLAEAAMCCGGPGLYPAQEKERSAAILARKFENVVASGADVLVTENASCLLQLRAGARLHAPGVRVLHVAEVLDAALNSARRREALPS